MNTEQNSSPLIPQGSLLDQKNRGRARFKLAVFLVLAVHGLGLVALLMQGCQKEQEPNPLVPDMMASNTPPAAVDTATDPSLAATGAPPQAPVPAVPGGPEGAMGTTPPPAPADLAPPPPPAPPVGTEYVIAKDDNFTTIGKKFKVSTKALIEANPGISPTGLQIGQKIMVPPPAPLSPPTTAAPALAENGSQVYTVKSGDTLSTIGKRFGTTARAIRTANNLPTDNIKVGQKLKIPVKTPAPAPVIPEAIPAAPAGTTP